VDVTVNLVNVNDAPEARRNSIRIDEDERYGFSQSDFHFRDVEGDELQAVIITRLPVNGTLYYCGQQLTAEDLCNEDGGFRVLASDLSKLSFQADADYNGQASFGYMLQDSGGTDNCG